MRRACDSKEKRAEVLTYGLELCIAVAVIVDIVPLYLSDRKSIYRAGIWPDSLEGRGTCKSNVKSLVLEVTIMGGGA